MQTCFLLLVLQIHFEEDCCFVNRLENFASGEFPKNISVCLKIQELIIYRLAFEILRRCNYCHPQQTRGSFLHTAECCFQNVPRRPDRANCVVVSENRRWECSDLFSLHICFAVGHVSFSNTHISQKLPLLPLHFRKWTRPLV